MIPTPVCISDVTLADIKDYIRESDNSLATNNLLSQIMSAALGYITSYTGLPVYDIDQIPEMTAVYKILIADMYDNRGLTVDNDKINPFAKSVLDMHCRNMVL